LYVIGFKLNVINCAKGTIKGQPIPTEMIGEGNGKEYTHSFHMYVYIANEDGKRADE
jgi:hypothetical protein